MGRNPARVDPKTLKTPRVVAYVLLGLLAFAIFLIVAAPASLLGDAVARASRETIVITGTSGSVWHGSGDLEMRPVSSPPLRIGRLDWTINPLWLVAGKIDVNVSLTGSGAALTGAARIGFGSLALRNLKATLPAQLVPVFYAPAELIGPRGKIEVSAPALAWSTKDGVTGNAVVLWLDVATSFSAVRPLGDYRLSLGEGGVLKLDTLRGDLRLTGHGTLDNTVGGVRFSGQASAAGRASELAEVFKLLGPGPDAGPRPFHFEFSLRN